MGVIYSVLNFTYTASKTVMHTRKRLVIIIGLLKKKKIIYEIASSWYLLGNAKWFSNMIFFEIDMSYGCGSIKNVVCSAGCSRYEVIVYVRVILTTP